jgi:dolichyl-phosphate-mannose--protein O-mannosyl transferase
MWVARRDWRYGLVVVGVAATWLPWFRYDDRPIFSYYASMSLPFLVLGATLLLGEMVGRSDASVTRRTLGTAAAGSVVVLTLVAFAWFWPIWTDQLLTNREWVERMWFRRWI